MGQITDVPGIRVGHVQKIGDGWLTGATDGSDDHGAIAHAQIFVPYADRHA